ncbi:MAG TPA: fructosamine kinase family protein [Gammaproteobacteria bacterium]|nr:fructosamine kinase family protein [Gammaproteobacteria bacterium]
MRDSRSLGGGCINRAMTISDGARACFVKANQAGMLPMFEAEAEALAEMAATDTLRVPRPICQGVTGGQAYLVLEYLDLRGSINMAQFGQQLAAMHRVVQSRFGWHRDNAIGATPQSNSLQADWIAFWRQQRLGFQLELAAVNGYGSELQKPGQQLLERFPVLFDGYQPQASMLHGDLWSGNAGALSDGTPVIFDPGFYYGDRECDIAMTELFGGFGGRFYAAYNEAWPLDAGYKTRKTLYNLYHILNHLNMFGGGYQSQALDMMRRLLAEVS